MTDKQWFKIQADKVRKADYIDPALYRKYGVKRGLRNDNGTGVLVGLTTIGNVHGYVMNEGEKQAIPGELYYRGIDVHDIVRADKREHRFGYEETAYLLLFGELPTARELVDWKDRIGAYRKLSDGFKDNAIFKYPPKDLMNALARAVLFAYAFDPSGNPDELSIERCLEQSIDMIGSIPTIVAYAYQAKAHYLNGGSLLIRNPDPAKSTAENILLLTRDDGRYTKLEAEILDLALILHAEHGGGNNSSFTTHVVTSAHSDMYSSIAASVLSLKGGRHGGANLRVMRQTRPMLSRSRWTRSSRTSRHGAIRRRSRSTSRRSPRRRRATERASSTASAMPSTRFPIRARRCSRTRRAHWRARRGARTRSSSSRASRRSVRTSSGRCIRVRRPSVRTSTSTRASSTTCSASRAISTRRFSRWPVASRGARTAWRSS